MTEIKRRGRPPKSENVVAAPVMEYVGKVSDPVPGNNGAALERLTEFFKAKCPAEWEGLRLCPLQHGLDEMVRLLD